MTLPGGQTVSLETSALNYELQRYLASSEPAPRTFTFDKLNFDTGVGGDPFRGPGECRRAGANPERLSEGAGRRSSAIPTRAARTPAMRSSGRSGRSRSVTALTAKGVGKERVTARSGGEGNPADTNATAQGQFENRRTELVVTAK